MRKIAIVGISFVIFVILLSFSLSVDDSAVHADAAETVLADHTTCAETKEALQTDIAAILSATPTSTATPYMDIALIESYAEPRDSVDEVTVYMKVKNISNAPFTDTLVIGFRPLGAYPADREVNWTGGIGVNEVIGLSAVSSIKTLPGETPHIVIDAAYGQMASDVNTANNSDVLYFPDYATPTPSPTVTATPAFITMTLPYSTTARIFLDTDIGETSTLVALALCAVSVLFALSLSRLR